MHAPSDAELLAEWSARRSEAAFARLVERYVALVLRYYQQRSLDEVGAVLGIGADAAQNQELVAGGWQLPSGNRAVVFVSPKPGDVAPVVTVTATILEYPASLANKLVLEEFSTDGKEAQMWKLLSSDQSDSILERAADAEGVKASQAAEVSTLTGRQAQIQAVEVRQTPSGEQDHLGPVIDVIPVIGPDGQSVDLVVRVELNLPKSSAGR